MNFKATKTPLLIAAMAAAVTLTSFAPANAKTYWANASSENVQVITADLQLSDADADAQVIDAKFKKHRSYRPHRSKRSFRGHSSYNRHKKVRGTAFDRGHGFKKKHHGSRHGVKKKVFIKKHF